MQVSPCTQKFFLLFPKNKNHAWKHVYKLNTHLFVSRYFCLKYFYIRLSCCGISCLKNLPRGLGAAQGGSARLDIRPSRWPMVRYILVALAAYGVLFLALWDFVILQNDCCCGSWLIIDLIGGLEGIGGSWSYRRFRRDWRERRENLLSTEKYCFT